MPRGGERVEADAEGAGLVENSVPVQGFAPLALVELDCPLVISGVDRVGFHLEAIWASPVSPRHPYAFQYQ